MKNILCLLMVLFASWGSGWGQTFEIVGPDKVIKGISYDYAIKLSAPAGSDLSFLVEIIGGERNTIVVIAKGYQVMPFKVKWTKETNSGKIIASLTSNLAAKAELSNIKVSKEGSSVAYNIKGPDKLYVLDEAIYSLDLDPALSSDHSWSISVNLAKVSEGNSSIKVRATGERQEFDSVKLYNSFYFKGDPVGTRRHAEVMTPLIKAKITPNNISVNESDNVTYTLSNYYPQASITWEGMENMILVSGQGTNKAIFKSSGSNKGKVRATISYNGNNYIVENSDVEIIPIDVPVINISITEMPVLFYQLIYATGIKGYNNEDDGNSAGLKVEWSEVPDIVNGVTNLPKIAFEKPRTWDTKGFYILGIREGYTTLQLKVSRTGYLPRYVTKRIRIVPIKDIYIETLNTEGIICNGNLTKYNLKSNLTSIGLSPIFNEGFSEYNYQINWTAQNLSISSGQGTANATFRATGNGYGKVKATITYDGQNYEAENSEVWIGPPFQVTEIGGFAKDEMTFMGGRSYTFSANLPKYATSLSWDVFGGEIVGSSTENQLRAIPMNVREGFRGVFSVYVYGVNRCGISNRFSKIGEIIGSGPGLERPQLKSGSTETLDSSAPVSIKVYSFTTGSLVYQNKKAINFNIQDTSLKNGIYIIETIDSQGNRTTEKVAKKNR